MRRLALVAVAATALAVVAAGASPPEASALGEPPPFTQLKTGGTSSSLWSAFKGLLTGQGSASTSYGTLIGGETATTQRGVGSMLYRARVGSRFLPVLGVAATRLTLIGTAGYIGWRIFQHYNGNDTTIDLWIDSQTIGADSLLNPCAVPSGGADFPTYTCGDYTQYSWVKVEWVKQSGSVPCGAVGGGDCFVLQFRACFSGGGCVNPFNSFSVWIQRMPGTAPYLPFYDTDPPAFREFLDVDDCVGVLNCYLPRLVGATTDGRGANGVAYMITRTIENLVGRSYAGTTITDDLTGVTVGSGMAARHRLLIPAAGLGPEAGLVTAPDPAPSPDLTTDYTVPSNAGDTTDDAAKAVAAFDTVCGRALINHLLSPTFYPWVPGCIEAAPEAEPEAETVTLLRPLSTETYTDYITRLQAAGWVGTATTIELDPYDPSIGPEVVSKVGVTGTTGTWRRALWPPTWPKIAITTDLDIYYNPATAPVVAPDPTDEETPPGGGDVYDPGGCEPWLEASPDFSPLTSLSVGSKFPFGLFAWVGGVLGSFSVVADAPNWTFDIVIPATSVSSETDLGEFTIDLAWADSYMTTVRLILTFVLWIGAVWYFATALLGLRAPGNPAEAVDDA